MSCLRPSRRGAGVRVALGERGCSVRVRCSNSVVPDSPIAVCCRRWHVHDRAERTFGILVALCSGGLGRTRHDAQTPANPPTAPKARRHRGDSAGRRFDRFVRPPGGAAAGGVRLRRDHMHRGPANAAGVPTGNGSRRRLLEDRRSSRLVPDVSAVRARHDAVRFPASLVPSRSHETPRPTGTPTVRTTVPNASGSALNGRFNHGAC